MRWSSAWPRPCGNIWTPSGAARREKQSDPGHRHGSVRHRPDRARARAFRRALRRADPGGIRARSLSPPSQARRVSRQAFRGEGGVFESARNRNPLSGELAQRLGRECPFGQALAQVLQAARRASQAARHRGRPRVARRRNRHGLRVCRGRGSRSEGPEEKMTLGPVMRSLGERWEIDAAEARALAEATGYVIAVELRSHGVDFSFAPVLDVDFGSSSVIGDRAFSDEPAVIAALAGAFVAGLAAGGAASVGKHFPGHGYVKADSHVDVPVDGRGLDEIEANDLQPYRDLIALGLAGVMPAHVIYPAVDGRPAGYSPVWLKDILRRRLGFDGMIFSDDLSMAGASVAGGVVQRAEAALAAGCDMILVCNAPQAAAEVLDGLKTGPLDRARAERMRGRGPLRPRASDTRYAAAVAAIESTSV